MPAKTAKTAPKPATKRDQQMKAYLLAFDAFATDATEVGKALDVKPAEATKILKSLGDLVCGDHTNGERTLTWQCVETYDSIDRDEAIKLFNAKFPEADADKPAKSGATGPRYTPEQIKAGLAARKAGKTNAEVAAAAGVKSPSYFAKTLKLIEHQATVKKVAAKKAPAKLAKSTKPLRARQPRKPAKKGDGPADLAARFNLSGKH